MLLQVGDESRCTLTMHPFDSQSTYKKPYRNRTEACRPAEARPWKSPLITRSKRDVRYCDQVWTRSYPGTKANHLIQGHVISSMAACALGAASVDEANTYDAYLSAKRQQEHAQ